MFCVLCKHHISLYSDVEYIELQDYKCVVDDREVILNDKHLVHTKCAEKYRNGEMY